MHVRAAARCFARTRVQPHPHSRTSHNTTALVRHNNTAAADHTTPSTIRLSPPHPPAPNVNTAASSQATSPLTVSEFSALLSRHGIPAGERVAVALSGGADSTALTLLAHHSSRAPPHGRPPPLILQVDHRLRPESGAETRYTATWLARLPVPPGSHVVLPLHWADGVPPLNRLQAAARWRRRAALLGACRVAGVRWLLLAQHAGDQVETIVHRWTRGSGLYGLVGMDDTRDAAEDEAAVVEAEGGGVGGGGGVVVCRPLLGVSKARLMATCRQYGVRWVEDASNDNRAFERIRIRQALDALLARDAASERRPRLLDVSAHRPARPMTADLLESIPSILSACQQSVHDMTTALLRSHATLVSPFTAVFLSSSAASLPLPILLMSFSRILAVVRGSTHMPMTESLQQIVQILLQEQRDWPHSTASSAPSHPTDVSTSRYPVFGCLITTLRGDGASQPGNRSGGWCITRVADKVAEQAVPATVHGVQTLRWDNRFTLQLSFQPPASSMPAGRDTGRYILRSLRESDLELFVLPRGSSKGELRHMLLTGLPVLVRRWEGEVATRGGVNSGEDVLLLPHVPFLPWRSERWDEAERERRSWEYVIQLKVSRMKGRVSKFDWTQNDDDASYRNQV